MTTATARKPKRDPYTPPVVGDPYTYTVTYSGIVDEVGADGSLRIGDHTVPRRTGNGVTMCMIGEPEPEGCADCIASTDAVDEAQSATIAARNEVLNLAEIIAERHDETHPGVYAFCEDTLCRQARDLVDGLD